MLVRKIIKIYNKTLLSFTKGEGFNNQKERSEFSLLLLSVLMTSILMWGYSLTSYLYVDHDNHYKLGLFTSVIHISSLFIYYRTRCIPLALNTFVSAGFIFQLSWALVTGGFQSPIIIWFALLPLIAGVVRGQLHLLVWGAVSILTSLTLFFLHISGYVFPNLVTPKGFIISQIFLSFGFIGLCSVFILAYILDREKFYQTLIAKNEQINSLLTIVGHDISNPLTVVTISTKKLKSLLSESGSERVKKYLERLDSSGKAMTEILNQIRDIQAIKEGKVELSLEKLHLNSLFEESLHFFESKIKSKNIELHYDFTKNQDLHILGHSTSLKYQVLNNIFSNAIKFSDQNGEIRIDVTPKPSSIEICIKDIGRGMEQEQLEILFDRNSRTSLEGTLGERGTGFGMPIVKSFVELNEGQIKVKSKTKLDFPHEHGTEILLSFKNATDLVN